ncbi:hypothetical protein A0U93_09820 [Neoasaia chiangmaiensis]|uniref:Arc-like DNA binding domain-containing protein n=1 Tax=Neoasaia chiangmaiensis TaxID=320497 RepID=A0A1U9KR31_9PROT|nr:hypothetical protein A0U93_09820 [Neoasaia chiangmaiensis]
MKDTTSITFRLERSIIRALKIRGVMNDRSANGEISAILREILKPETTSGPSLAANPDAFQQ